MEDYLSQIMHENDRMYVKTPLEYRVFLNDLGEVQNQVLLSFLRHESVSTNCGSNSKGDSFLRLSDFLNKRRDGIRGISEVFNKIAHNSKFLSFYDNIPQCAFLDLKNLFDCENKLVDLDETFYEAVFANMAQEADMRTNFSRNMIDSFDFRKVVYQKIFPEREQFEWYKGVGMNLDKIISESVCGLVDAIDEKNSSRFLGRFLGGSAKKFFGKFTVDCEDGTSLEKKFDYIRSVANRIYDKEVIGI